MPTTNPTSTAIFKALLTLKTRNALVLCPHPRAAKATIAAAKIVADAAVEAGAPPGIISWIEHPSMAVSQALMQSPEISLILATGGPAMVKSAYSSGHPSVGVGAGNTPAVIDDTANIEMAVSSILLSKTFDNGVICASEQSVVVHDKVYDAVKAEFVKRGAYFLSEEEKVKVRAKVIVNGRLNADIVGQSVQKLAEIFGIKIPIQCRVIIGEIEFPLFLHQQRNVEICPRGDHPTLTYAPDCVSTDCKNLWPHQLPHPAGEIEEIGHQEPLSEEKLSPVLGMYRASSFDVAVDMADRLVRFAGPGHTSVLYTNPLNRAAIDTFGKVIKTVRVLINTPASQVGGWQVRLFCFPPLLDKRCKSWIRRSTV